MNTLTAKTICDKVKDYLSLIVKDAVKFDEMIFRSFYKSRVSEFGHGFRSIDKIPINILAQKIISECLTSELIAKQVLKSWYHSKSHLREVVENILESCRYKIYEPDFQNNSFHFNSLRKEHVLETGDKCFIKHFEVFKPFKEIEPTLMSAILGWYPVDDENEKQDNSELNNNHENSNEDIESTIESLSDIDLINRVDDDYAVYHEKKTMLVNEVKQLSDDITKDHLPEDTQRVAEMITMCREMHSRVVLKLNLLQSRLFTAGAQSNGNQTLEQRLTNSWRHILQIRSNDLSALIPPVMMTDEQIKSLKLKVDDLTARISGSAPGSAKELLKSMTNLKSQIVEEIQKRSLKNICSKYQKEKSGETLTELIDILKYNLTPEELFCVFLLATGEGYDVSEKYDEDVVKVCAAMVQKHSMNFAYIIASDTNLAKLCGQAPHVKRMRALIGMSIYLHGAKQEGIALLYENNNYSVFDDRRELKKLIEQMMEENEITIGVVEKQVQLEALNELKTIFNRDGSRYVNLETTLHGLDIVFRNALAKHVYPVMLRYYQSVLDGDKGDLEKTIFELSVNEYVDNIFKRTSIEKLPSNHNSERKSLKFIEETSDKIKEVASWRLKGKSGNNRELINRDLFQSDLKIIGGQYPSLNTFVQLLLGSGGKTIMVGKDTGMLMTVLYQEVLRSVYFARCVPEMVIQICKGNPTTSDLMGIFIRNADNDRRAEESYQTLIQNEATAPAKLLAVASSLPIADCDRIVREKQIQLAYLRSNAENNNVPWDEEYTIYEKEERWGVLIEQVEKLTSRYQEIRKTKSELFFHELKDIGKKALEWKTKLIDDEGAFPRQTIAAIEEGLNHVEQISKKRLEHKKDLAMQILHEIEHLWQYKEESLDHLSFLNTQAKNDDTADVDRSAKYMTLDMEKLLDYVQSNKHDALGLTAKQWEQISTDRREDIVQLIEAWIYLRDKHTVYEDVQAGRSARGEIEEKLKSFSTRLARICNLYKTNENKRIGQDPFEEWKGTDIPFIFCTKIQNPRCDALDQPIRMYFFTEPYLSTKRYINHVRDYIIDRGYQNNSFSVFVVLGDRDKMEKNNTSSITKSIPILDEYALKKIMFSTHEDKLPKWEFVSLMTLNNKISVLQPFKTQGSVSSDMAIFVGREDLIKEMTTVPRDYAIYGGRRIGKSSLLSEVRKQLEQKGYITAYQSFQGFSDLHAIARAIVQDLQIAFNSPSGNKPPVQTFDDFSLVLQRLYSENPERNVVIFLDEVDELIVRERALGSDRHQIIEIFRDMSHKTDHRWRFIFAGFKEMYLEIHGKGIYDRARNPWENFIDDSNKQLKELESPRELIDEGLRNILGLEYDREVANLIENYSSGHPAFLQKFCQCLVQSVDEKISPKDRKIYIADVKRVFEHDSDFIRYVKETIDLNLSDIQKAIIIVAGYEKKEKFMAQLIHKKLTEYIDLFGEQLNITLDKIQLELELLLITGVVKKTSSMDEYEFSHPYYIQILNQFERVDKDHLEHVIKRIPKDIS